ncbi:alpha/beta-hydrolase [Aspergillus ellipticus CBS 707.79]|uniref:Alpha/beta-hydrolase n=1 Tax=Aspergillus ellipticus CBS 707.79 TaxID=1448320 RepID=A0A319DQC0_9EURO|nr:alpha/beta-hydrolase [Aspergillus ellipticus CBS 707.79]
MISLQLASLAIPALLTVADARSVPASSTFTPIKWSNCTIPSPGFDCGTLEVPIDWDEPFGAKVQLGMLRQKALKPEKRIGSFFFNPGGPGDNATIYVEAATEVFGQDMADAFDIIGLDPRGVGLSSPIRCDPDIYNQRVPLWPSNQTELNAIINKNKALGESCYNMTGPLMKHLDSVSVAKDLEAIRQALGDEKLNYLGLSYGTLIGQTYAELFPQNIRSMTLDGNMDHSTDQISYLTVKTFTYEDTLYKFADWCSTSTSCPLNGTSADVLKVWDDLVAHANKTPIPAPSCKASGSCLEDVTGWEIQYNANSMLFIESGVFETWPKLGLALYEARYKRDASLLATSKATSPSSSAFEGTAISCLDWFHPQPNLVNLKNKYNLATSLFPHVGMGDVGENHCMGWPFPQVNPEHRANIHGTPRILQVNSQHDPSCSYVWANGLQEQISNSTLLTRKGNGHTSYFLFGESWEIINAYHVNLTVPADNTFVSS